MRVTEYTDDELREKIKELFSLASDWNDESKAYLKEQRDEGRYGGRDEDYRTLTNEVNRLTIEASSLRESGQIPWISFNGFGNNCDISGHSTKVVARRVFDLFADESESSEFGGRAIELAVILDRGADTMGTRYMLTFRNPLTVKAVIEQLQMELDGWNDWDGGFSEV